MLAIYRSNPSAFAGGRLNGLYRGVRLAIPAQAQIQAESEAEAQTLLRQGKMDPLEVFGGETIEGHDALVKMIEAAHAAAKE